MTKLTALLLLTLVTSPAFSSAEPVSFSINTKKWSHVLDDHFISITVNPTDLLQGKVYGLTMNSTMSILRGLAPAYVRIGSADTAKYTFRRNKYPSDVVKPEDEYTVTETHWMVFNEMVQSAGLDVIVCLNAAHRVEGTKKWDTRNSLELISFSDSQGYNLTWQLGYEIQADDDLSGIQFGKDLNRLRTILNAFPRYQHSKLIGPDIRVIHKKEDVDFWNDVLIEAGPTLDAVTWHPRWPQPSKMKVSDNSDLGYEFPVDYLEWDRSQLNKILQRSIFKNPIWIGESKRESTGTFAEGLIWAKRLVLSAKLGIEVVMKQPNLMDVTHPKPEYWIALLHKKLLGKAVLETRSVTNMTDLAIISHCTNPYYWTDKPEKLQDGPITLYTVNMGGAEQKVHIKGIPTGKSQLLFQYVLTSGSDPDSVFSQMTYLNGEPLMMTDDGMLPDIVPKIKKIEKGLSLKLPPYSIGFWVVPEAKVKICHVQLSSLPPSNVETLTPSTSHRSSQKDLTNIENINQFIVEKLKNPESDSEEIPDRNIKIEVASSESSEKEINLAKENHLPRVARKIREAKNTEQINEEIRKMMQETQDILSQPNGMNAMNKKMKLPKPFPSVERRIQHLAEGISDAIKTTNQQHEFDKFLEDAGLQQNFGSLLMNERRINAPGVLNMQFSDPKAVEDINTRLKRSVFDEAEFSEDESVEDESSQESVKLPLKFGSKITLRPDESEGKNNKKQKDLIIPHQPDLKGLEEKYKAILQIKLDDGKRKIDDLKKKIKQEEEEIAQKSKSIQKDDTNGLQKEIILKEIELLQKTEDTVADILDNQAKRQNTFKDIIFDELDNVKEEKMSALKEMYKNFNKNDNKIVKRQVQSFSTPLMKTVKYIERNFDLEPENVKKIKRSLEEKMGEILRNYDIKKQAETKKRMAIKDDESEYGEIFGSVGSRKSGRTDEHRSLQGSKDRTKEKNFVRKHSTPSPKSQPNSRSYRKYDSVRENSRESMRSAKNHEEPISKSKDSIKPAKEEGEVSKIRKHSEKRTKSLEEEEFYETLNSKKYPERFQKYDKKVEQNEEKPRKTVLHRDDHKQLKRIKNIPESERIKIEKTEVGKSEKAEENTKTDEDVRDTRNNFTNENKHIKNEEERRERMLKQISSMVENFNSLEKESGRSKRMNIDEDISLEFESDRRSRSLKRRPRRAEIVDFVSDQQVKIVDNDKKTPEKAEQMIQTTAAPGTTPGTSTTPTNKPGKGKSRRNRKRPNRKQKTETTEQKQDTPQKKRHLMQAELPKTLLEQEKKKLSKPKLRKINPKFLRFNSDLPAEPQTIVQEENLPQTVPILSSAGETLPQVDEKMIGTETVLPVVEKTLTNLEKEKEIIENEQVKVSEHPEMPVVILSDQKKELLKDLEELVEQKRFLDPTSETFSDNLQTNVEKSLGQKNMDIDFSGETPEPTEGYIVVEPTVEGKIMPENTEEEKIIPKNTEEGKVMPEKTEEEVLKSDQNNLESGNDERERTKIDQQKLEEQEVKFEEPKTQTLQLSENMPAEKKFFESSKSLDDKQFFSNELSSEDLFGSDELKGNPVMINKEEPLEEFDNSLSNNNRKRRATSPTIQNKQDDKADDDDYSSEERIQKFKQMIYRTSPSRKATKNEIRSPSSSGGMGADEFLRMAGSTVRVVFDDVIPEAYGQTKDKIQNMGISEYIKEFGKIVQQMRNLDQIFLNIGEAAVKGYIKGNRADKGPYIQVISRKKRSVAGDDSASDQTISAEIDSTTKNSDSEKTIAEETHIHAASKENTDKKPSPEDTSGFNSKQTEKSKTSAIEINKAALSRTKYPQGEKSGSENKYARTDTTEAIATAKRGNTGSPDSNWQWNRKDGHRQTQQATRPEKEEKEKTTEAVSMKADKSKHVNSLSEASMIKERHSDMAEETLGTLKQKEIKSLTKSPKTKHEILGSTGIVKPIVSNFKEEITPWIKTTEDFIQQALTTLQRQQQLSDIFVRDGISVMKKNIDKNLEKREIGSEEIDSRVSRPLSSKNNKRETELETNEHLIRTLRGLAPGVYVVPTAEMTNIRSEQITNEAKEKSGLPNVVTLNIYYDKKNQDGSPKIEEDQSPEPKTNHDLLSYYQTDPWNSVVGQYDQNNQYVSPIGMPELRSSLVSPLQVNPLYASGSRAAGLPNSRLVQYPTANYHYPVPQNVLPPVVTRPSQPVLSPVVYLQPDNSFMPQPPGTKTQWRDFRLSGTGAQTSDMNSGWNLQYKTSPKRKSSKTKSPTNSYNTNFKVFTDKKRSVDDGKASETSPDSPLPFWKFFATASSEKSLDNLQARQESEERNDSGSLEAYSAEDAYTEKEIKENKENKLEINDPEENAAGLKKEEEDDEEDKDGGKDVPKSRNRRSLTEPQRNEFSVEMQPRNLAKRSYQIHFTDHDVVPQWFGNYQGIGNGLEEYPQQGMRSEVISTSLLDEDDDLLSAILNADDELSLLGVDDDNYYYNDNSLTHLRRYPRSTNNLDSAMLKTNMIYKTPIDGDLPKQKLMDKTAMKNLMKEDSSLELVTKSNNFYSTANPRELQRIQNMQQQQLQKQQLQLQQQLQQHLQQQLQQQLQLQQQQQAQQNYQQPLISQPVNTPKPVQQPVQPQFAQNGTFLLPSNPNDDAFYFFFKYAYDSFLKMMKSMSQLF